MNHTVTAVAAIAGALGICLGLAPSAIKCIRARRANRNAR